MNIIESKFVDEATASRMEVKGRKINREIFENEFTRSRDRELRVPRWRLLHLSEVVNDSDFLLTMFNSASHSGHELKSVSRIADECPIADAIDALPGDREYEGGIKTGQNRAWHGMATVTYDETLSPMQFNKYHNL